jgi:signal peptidase I
VISHEPGPGEPGAAEDAGGLAEGDLDADELDGSGPDADAEDSSPRRVGRAVREWVIVIGGALVVALLIRTFLFQAYEIPSPSMVDTLKVGDRVLVNKLSYKLHDIHRGDVVVFKRPPGEPDPKIKDLIKRVVGLPGETLQFKDCQVFVDGKALVEPYTDGQCTDPPQDNIDGDGDGAVTVPDGMLFVMGDNRGASFDSRYFGPITESTVVGRAFMIMWPFGDWSWL